MSIFRSEVIREKKNQYTGEVLEIKSPAYTFLALFIVFFLLSLLIFLSVATYNKKETINGSLEPIGGSLRIYNDENGIVDKLFVTEGSIVTEGDVLVSMKIEKNSNKQIEVGELLKSLLDRTLDNIRDEAADHTKKFDMLADYHNKILMILNQQKDKLSQELLHLQKRIDLNADILDKMKSISANGFYSALDVARQEDFLISLRLDYYRLESQILDLNQEIILNQKTLSVVPIDQRLKHKELENSSFGLLQQLAQVSHESSFVIKSPRTGVVSSLAIRNGQNLATNTALMTILPSDVKLEAVLYVPSKAIAFIKVGQQVRLKYEAFPYARFGFHVGKVVGVSNSIFMPGDIEGTSFDEPSYRVSVEIPTQYIKDSKDGYSLMPGMKLSAEIITENRSFISWLLSPFSGVKGRI